MTDFLMLNVPPVVETCRIGLERKLNLRTIVLALVSTLSLRTGRTFATEIEVIEAIEAGL